MTTFYTADQVFVEGRFAERAFLGVDGDTIVSSGTQAPPAGNDVVDFGRSAIFPGGVNTHTHTYLSWLRGTIDGLPFTEWLARVYAAVDTFDEEAAYLGAALSFGEMLASGTTTVADFFYLNGRGNGRIREAIRAATDLGIRLAMGRTFLDAEWGGDATRETVDVASARFRELWSDYEGDPLVQLGPAPHSLYGASREMIEAAFSLAEEYDTLWYLHVADSRSSAARVREQFGSSTVHVLDSWGVLTGRLVSVHGLWLDDDELDLLAARGGRISYNPASNMFFGERILDVTDLWRRGLLVGLATDGAASNNSLDLLADVRLASLAQKVRAGDPAVVTADDMVRLMTADGGRVLNLPVGRLEPGFKADFVVFDTLDFSLQPAAGLTSNIVHAASDRAVQRVFCGGREVVRDGRLVLVDHDALRERIAGYALRLSADAPVRSR